MGGSRLPFSRTTEDAAVCLVTPSYGGCFPPTDLDLPAKHMPRRSTDVDGTGPEPGLDVYTPYGDVATLRAGHLHTWHLHPTWRTVPVRVQAVTRCSYPAGHHLPFGFLGGRVVADHTPPHPPPIPTLPPMVGGRPFPPANATADLVVGNRCIKDLIQLPAFLRRMVATLPDFLHRW